MKKTIYKINKAYDKIDEPWRMLLMLVVLAPWFLGLSLYKTFPLLYLFGAFYVGIIAITRIGYIAGLFGRQTNDS